MPAYDGTVAVRTDCRPVGTACKNATETDPAKFELAVSLIKNSKDFMEGTIFPTMDLDTGYYQAKICPTT